MKDIQLVKEAIEIFAVRYFKTEMAGKVSAIKNDKINYFSIDLQTAQWDQDVTKLHNELFKYLQDWAKVNFKNLSNYISISKLTLEYILPEKNGTNQNVSKHIKLFYLSPHYYNANVNEERSYGPFTYKVLKIWYNPLLRNTIITALITIFLLILAINKIQRDKNFGTRLIKSYEYINIGSGIIASFVLGYLINKVILIRQHKQTYTKRTKELSNKLTYFRKFCYNLDNDHGFWHPGQPFYESFEYAQSIKHDISFENFSYPDFTSPEKTALFRSFFKPEQYSESIVSLILQLHKMIGDDYLTSGLTLTDYPPNYIYLNQEMEKYLYFCESNLIWYCSQEEHIFPTTFTTSYHTNEMIKDINRIYPKNKIKDLTKDKVVEMSLDFQYRIIPELNNLTRLIDAKLPLAIQYFVWAASLLLTFGIIIPTLTFLFIDKTYAFLSIFFVIGVIIHILLTLSPILEAENQLDNEYDFL